ncbi:hypothetical protein B484DRAFT_471638, partial [Ochromonadaceae sp. CCMP2298]
QAAEQYLQANYSEAYSVWDPAWRVLFNEGHLRPGFTVDDITAALAELQINRKEDLLLLVDGSAFEEEDEYEAALEVLYRLFGTEQKILLQDALADSVHAAELLADQVAIPAHIGAGKPAGPHHYQRHPRGRLDAAEMLKVPDGVNLADPSTWLCPGTPCCDGTPHICRRCGRRHYRHKNNAVVMTTCAQCWNKTACQASNQKKALAAGVTRPPTWPDDDAITEASGYWFGFV